MSSSGSMYHPPRRESDTCCFLPQFQTLNPQLLYHNINQANLLTPQTSFELYSALEASLYPGNLNNISASNVTISSNGAPALRQFVCPHSRLYHLPQNQFPPDNKATTFDDSPITSSTITDDMAGDLKYKLLELEAAMLGPDSDLTDSYTSGSFSFQANVARTEMDGWDQLEEMIAHKDVKRILIACAKAVSANDPLLTQLLAEVLKQMVSVSGSPIQRLGAYMLEGLVARLSSSGSLICKALGTTREPPRSDLLSYTQILQEVCPYIKFGYMSANGAIAEAMKDEEIVHIIDFQIGQGSQWVTLIQAFAARPGGPPRIRITGVDDPHSACAPGGGIGVVGHKLERLAQLFRVPLEFHGAAAVTYPSAVKAEDLSVRPGEALAVNFAFTLHHMPDESVSTENQRDKLLRMVRSLSPKVVTLVEQECNTNSAAFFPRFVETLDYYTAMFESMDETLPRDHRDRINVEQHCLARDVVNLIACEGAERVERHELLGKWRLRFLMAGFSPCPLSPLVNMTIKSLLMNYSDKYKLEEKDGALYLGWMDRNLVASCAWMC